MNSNKKRSSILRGSFICKDSDCYYFKNLQDENKLYSLKTNNSIKLCDENVNSICTQGEWIYFTHSNGNAISRIKKDGSELKRIYKSDVDVDSYLGQNNSNDIDINISNILICEEWIFFCEFASEELKKIRIDGNAIKVLRKNIAHEINIVGDYIYFVDEFDGRLHRITNYLNKQAILTSEHYVWDIINIKSLNVVDSCAFFIQLRLEQHNHLNNSNFGKVTKINLETEEKHILLEDMVSAIEVIDNEIFYLNRSDAHSLYRIDANGSGKVRLSNSDNIINIKALDYWIYFYTSNSQIYKIRFDGSCEQLVF